MSGDLNLPAFPTVFSNSSGSLVSEQGMTLRDYFAAKAMAAYIMSKDAYERPTVLLPNPRAIDIPVEAYAMADAMIRARQA